MLQALANLLLKLNLLFVGYFDPVNMMIVNIIILICHNKSEFRGDLTDMSAKTKTLASVHIHQQAARILWNFQIHASP